MVFGGEKSVDTKYSFGELVRRLHRSIENLNALQKQHYSITEPTQRGTIQQKIVREMFRFQILSKKLVRSYLNMIETNFTYASKLISNMDINTLISRYPQYDQTLENFQEQTKQSLNWVIEEEGRERVKSNSLRRAAKGLRRRSKSMINDTKETIEKKKVALQSQQRAQAQRQQ